MIRQFELVEKVRSYDPKVDEDALNRAYVFAMKAHGTQKRASGDPYFSHPLEVAGILCEMRLDTATIITALLHDTVEDTEATLKEISVLFGEEIATLVDGVTKLTQIELQSTDTKQAENFRKLVLAMSNDIRVLLVKLADRLHNMRTLHFVKSKEKRLRIAGETLEIYAPLAERIGMHHFKDELEDLAFHVTHPDARESILNRLQFLEQEGGKKLVERIVKSLKSLLKKESQDLEIFGRIKRPYSIWRKMRRQNISIEQLADIMAFRVLVPSVGDCYQVLGTLHSEYHVLSGCFKDYISTPKPNGYQSLHTTVIGPENKRVEIQIRTYDMHQVAEFGVAAHWQYKQTGSSAQKAGGEYRWLRSLLEILEHASNPEEFLEHTKLEMFQDQVFAFTPNGDLISMPSGATPVDFAYAIHSEVGNRCVGARVNGSMVPLRTQLTNGDQVEILTSNSQTPSPTWDRFVVTGKARANIRRFVRIQQRAQYVNLGRSIVHKAFHSEHIDFSEKMLSPVLEKFNLKQSDDLYALVGEGQRTPQEIIRLVAPDHKQSLKKPEDISVEAKPSSKGFDATVSIKGLIPGMAVHYAGCCHPLPGDKIVGIVMTGRGVTIHTFDCDNLNNFLDEPERWIDVSWDIPEEGKRQHLGRLKIILANQQGALATLTSIVSGNKANIANMRFTTRSEDYFDILIDLEVKDTEQLYNIMGAMRASSFVHSVERDKS